MGKLINADVFDGFLQDAQAECKKNGGNFRFGVLNSVRANLANQPAVDAVPVVHARWRELKDGSEECTNCLGLCPHEENYNGDIIFNFGCEYCPWCGAKMDGERSDEDAAD